MKYILFSIVLLISLLGCEQSIDLDVKANVPKLVVYGQNFADSIPMIILTETQSFYGWLEQEFENQYVKDATVTLSGNGSSQNLLFQEEAFPVIQYDYEFGRVDTIQIPAYTGNIPLQKGVVYTMEAVAGEIRARGNFTIPETPNIISVEQTIIENEYLNYYYQGNNEIVDTFISYSHAVKVILEGVQPGENAYDNSVQIRYPDYEYDFYYDPYTGQEVFLDSILIYRENRGNVVLNEETNQYEAEVEMGYSRFFDHISGDTVELEIEVFASVSDVDSSSNAFFTSLRNQRDQESDPISAQFSEPIFIDANMEEGMGLLSGNSRSEPVKFTFRYWRLQ